MSTVLDAHPTVAPGSTSWLSRLEALSNWRLGAVLFVPLLLVYIATGNANAALQSPDAVAAALPAWHFAHAHTLHLNGVGIPNIWLMTVHHHVVSNRQPGVIGFGVPFYLLLDRSGSFSMFPAVVAAATAAAGAVAFLTLTMRTLVSTRFAVVGGLVVGFGTATWSVSADTLWPHGPDQLFLAAGLYFLSRNRRVAAAVVLALTIPVRAHLVVVAVVAAVWFAVRDRSIRPLLTFGAPATVAVAGLLAYNRWTFGAFSLNGGYPYPTQAVLGEQGTRASLPTNILGSIVSLDRGLLIWCPLLFILLIGIRPAWREAPDWARIGAIGGILYFLIQMKLNFFSGGDRFWSYRLTIETVTLAVPLLALSARHLLDARPGVFGRVGAAAAIYGIGTQAIGAIWYHADNVSYSPWSHSKLVQELFTGGIGPILVADLTLGLMIAALAGRPRGVFERLMPGDHKTRARAPMVSVPLPAG